MTEKEMLLEINRLRNELAELREERDCLHKMVCKMFPMEETQLTEKDLKHMRDTAVTFEELLGDSPRLPGGSVTYNKPARIPELGNM